MIFEKVKEIIVAQFGADPDALTEETEFVADLNADSLDVLELAMTIEETFDLPEIGEEDIKSIQTIGDLVAYVKKNVD